MTTGPEELSLNYLLDPTFQLVNTAGRPLTNGWIEVYYHGTRNKYYCASDFDGTLHPFRIPLDSLGSNIVLADPNFSYDIYVYNSFGSLQMSRYNVNPGSGSGGGSSGEGGPAEHWSSDTAGGASTTVTGGTTVYLTLPSSEDQPEFVDHTTDTAIFLKEGLYHIDAVVSFKQDEDDLQNIIKDLVVNTGLMGWDAQMTGQKNWTGPESTDDDRHFLELHTVVSVPEDSLQTLYFQISSPVDLESAAIEKLDIVKLEQGGGGTAYTAGYGIQIDGQVISTSGMMPESSAANFVNVETYNTDIQNIYETIAETSAMIPSGVATEQFVEDYTSAFITEDDLDGYATQEWVVDQGYITSADIPDIPEDVITSGELATVSGDIVAQIPSLDGYATEQWVNEQNFITSADLPQSVPLVAGEGISIVDTSASTIISVDSAYSPGVSEEWVEDYVSDATSGFITSADIPDVPEDVVTSAELATVSGDIVSQIPDTSDMATQTWVNEQGFLTSIPEDLVTSGELATVSGEIMSQMPSQTTVSIDPTFSSGTKIAEFRINGTSGELFAPEGGGSIEYPLVYSASDFNDPMTSAYAENSWYKYYTSESPLGLTAISIRKSDNSLYAGGLYSDHLNFVADGEDYTVFPSNIEHWNNTYNAVDTSAAYWNSAYNAINASASYWNAAAGMNEYPISAGPGMSIEDVDGVTVFQTSGTMMDDLIEFNSQDEISGYNGHPVMTVDSEKQWLTHDDTIAHVTNSAQYAFGVNVPVVAQAMGTDETVLFETSAVNGAGICPLSESLKNFEQIKVLATRGYNGSSNPNGNGGTGPWSFWDTDGIMSDGADYHSVTPFIFEGYNWKNSCYSANNEYNLLTWYRGCQKNMISTGGGTQSSSFTDCVGIKKIVGIGRKEN